MKMMTHRSFRWWNKKNCKSAFFRDNKLLGLLVLELEDWWPSWEFWPFRSYFWQWYFIYQNFFYTCSGRISKHGSFSDKHVITSPICSSGVRSFLLSYFSPWAPEHNRYWLQWKIVATSMVRCVRFGVPKQNENLCISELNIIYKCAQRY